jgi:hypothetical protein
MVGESFDRKWKTNRAKETVSAKNCFLDCKHKARNRSQVSGESPNESRRAEAARGGFVVGVTQTIEYK